MAEAAVALCSAGAPSGKIVYSLDFLREVRRAIRTLDGRALYDA
jgi:hypothetical protein